MPESSTQQALGGSGRRVRQRRRHERQGDREHVAPLHSSDAPEGSGSGDRNHSEHVFRVGQIRSRTRGALLWPLNGPWRFDPIGGQGVAQGHGHCGSQPGADNGASLSV
ncbi:hypothetical protein M0R45_025981 [Rubus argutus]|uniref:Uncharacterized protein n=1 Tax=Rubus argutus TaxID=59490 RepID=A0AAW1WZK1_RUBAR